MRSWTSQKVKCIAYCIVITDTGEKDISDKENLRCHYLLGMIDAK